MKIKVIITVMCLNIMLTLAAGAQNLPFFWGSKWHNGSRAAAMGGAYTGIARGEGAFMYNPAGLALAKTTELYAGFSRIAVKSDAEVFGASSAETMFNSGISNAGVAVPLPTSRGSLVFGIGYNKFQNFDRSIYGEHFNPQPTDSVNEGYSEIETGAMGRTALGCAIEAAPGIFLGGSLNFWNGQNDFTSQRTEDDSPYNMWTFSKYYKTINVLTRFSGMNFTLSALMKNSPRFQLGAAVSSPVSLSNKEDYTYSEKTDWDNGNRTNDSTAASSYTYRINSPWKYRLGGALKAGPLLVSADVEFNDYSQIAYKDDPPVGTSTMSEANLDIRRNLVNTMDYSVGGELVVPGIGIILRAGYAVRKTPYKDSDFAKDRTYISFGCGFAVNSNVTLNISMQTTSWNGKTDNTVKKENITAKNIMAGFVYQL